MKKTSRHLLTITATAVVLVAIIIVLVGCARSGISPQPMSNAPNSNGQVTEDIIKKPSPQKEGTLSIPEKEPIYPSSQVEAVTNIDNELNDKQMPADSEWDVVVLGRIDACWVCQNRPQPHVSYTRVLEGEVTSGQAEGQLALVAVADQLLPEGGIPMYLSQQEEICFLERVVVPGYEDDDVYKVVAVKEATPKNLATFLDQ